MKRLKKAAGSIGAVLFWLLLWQGGAMLLGHRSLLPLPTPLTTAAALVRLSGDGQFWLVTGASLLRILIGFAAGFAVGCGSGWLSHRFAPFHRLTAPLLHTLRAIPVASFTLLVFLWVPREYIPSCIACLTVLPVVWVNMEAGFAAVSVPLREMAWVMGASRRTVLREITLPGLRPSLSAALVTGLGFAWKSGVAAEVICRTQTSLGDWLWTGKNTVNYDEVFALTAVIVLLSVLLEQGVRRLLKGVRHDPT